MPRKKKKKSTTNSGLRVSYPKAKKLRRKDDDHWSNDFEDGLEAGFAAAELASELIIAILRFF